MIETGIAPIDRKSLVFGGKESPVPYLTFGVTDKCNLNCQYCCPGAENHGFEGQPTITVEEMLEIGKLAYEGGVRIFRVTGGEPTIWKSLPRLLEGLRAMGEDVRINLNSNATLPHILLPLLEQHKDVLTLRVSIDSVQANEGTPKYLSGDLETTIRAASEIVPTRLNMVVTRDTLGEMPELIERCRDMTVDLKLLDLYYNRDYNCGEERVSYWQSKFVPVVRTVEPYLLENGFSFTNRYDDGGYGIPLPLYTDGIINISIKDSTLGTREHPGCLNCAEYPCQEGLYSPMLSNTGVLHVSECRHEQFMFPTAGRALDEKRLAVNGILRLFSEISRRERPADLVADYIGE